MFHKAVYENNKTVHAPRSATLAQHVQIISGSTAPKRTSEMAFSSSRTQSQEANNTRTLGSHRPNLLNPRHEVLLSVAHRTVGGSDEAAVTAQPLGLSKVLNKPNSFQENVTTPAILNENQVKAQGDHRLQNAVYFDENDFDDDNDLDLDFEDPSHKETMLPPPEQSASGPNPLISQDTYIGVHPSSTPFPWSSSPAERRAAPARKPLSKTQSMPSDPRSIGQGGVDANPRSGKRRNLPWKQTPGKEASNGENGDYPWEQTASAVKEEQRRLRQSNKRQISMEKKNSTSEAPLSSTQKVPGKVFLTDEQKHVADLVIKEGKSVFFTGSAGTGKSVLLREIIRGLQVKYAREPDRVAVTASTGLAACNVGGVTLHSYSGIGLGKESAKDLVRKIKKNGKARTRWMRTKVLIIDEISMVDGELFDKLEEVARIIRNSGRPFGGLQLIITGDFFQLPPVPDHGKLARFAFEAATWSTSIVHTIGLTQVFRQKDEVFASMLNEMRLGELSKGSIDTFKGLSRPIHYKDDIDATELFPTRNEVDGANNNRMGTLVGEDMVFAARDGGTMTDKDQRDKLLSNCMAPAMLRLKKGAQVMLIKNLDDTLVNGSLGRVQGFMDEAQFEIYSQTHVDYEVFEAQGPEHEEMAKLSKKLKHKADSDGFTGSGQKWPYVRFSNADGTSRSMLCHAEQWKIELPNGEVQASRSQVPLILAWALSIHKAQGQTLERVKVDLGKVFEKGQAYVALSRATCREGLQVLRFDPKKVMAHEKVRQFYDGLYKQGVAGPVTSSVKRSAASRRGGNAIELDEYIQDMDDADEEEALMRASG